MDTGGRQSAPERRPSGLTLIAAGRLFVGGVVVGLGVNAVSEAYPGAAPVAVGGAVFLVLLAAEVLRKIPPGAPLLRLVSRVCLTGAAVAVVVSAVVVTPWASWAVLVSATLALTACLVPAPRDRIFDQLLGVGLTGIGVAGIGPGIRMLAWGLLLGPVEILLGLSAVGFGVSFLLGGEMLRGAAATVLAAALVGLGVVGLLNGQTVPGAALIAAGLAAVGFWAHILEGDTYTMPLWAAIALAAEGIAIGVLAIHVGVVGLLEGDTLRAAAAIAAGVSMVGAGVGFGVGVLLGVWTLAAAAAITTCVSMVGVGVSSLLEAETLRGAAMIVLGLGGVGLGVFGLRGEPRLVAWIGNLVKAPPPASPGTDAAAEHPPSPDPDSPPAGAAAPGTP